MNKSPSSKFLRSIMSSASRMRMSTKPKEPSHYDTLEVNSRATQGEIKSAYFKLSKQYHPDKNKSEGASQKFRDIAEAYEVLGNFNNRKVYDRSLIVKPRHERDHGKSSATDPKMQYYQTQATIFRTETKFGSTPTFDFDEWTRAHYGRTLRRNIQDKYDAQRLREIREHFHSPSSDHASQEQSILVISLLFLAALIMLSIRGPRSYDYYLAEREKEKSQEAKIPQESQEASNSVSSN